MDRTITCNNNTQELTYTVLHNSYIYVKCFRFYLSYYLDRKLHLCKEISDIEKAEIDVCIFQEGRKPKTII